MSKNEHIPSNEESSNFGLPNGYFQKSASSILNRIEWEEEHKNYPELLKQKGNFGFIVRENYFNKSEQRLELISYPKLSSQNKKAGFISPPGYFEEIELRDFTKNFNHEQDELSVFANLNAISKLNSFIVNDVYFSESTERLNAMLREHRPSQIITLLFSRVSYAAAAVLVLAIGFWVYTTYFKSAKVQDCGSLACVDKSDLVKTKNLESMDDEELYELVNTKNLEEKLEGNENKASSQQTDSSLNQVSTDDLLDEI